MLLNFHREKVLLKRSLSTQHVRHLRIITKTMDASDEASPPSSTTPNGDIGDISTLGHTTQESQLYRGRKGSFHRQHKNKRAEWLRATLDIYQCVASNKSCQVCKTKLKEEYDCFVPPLILHVHHDNTKPQNTIVTHVPEKLTLGDTSFKLSACSYTDGGHFVAITNDFKESSMYFSDGMENNAQFIKLVKSISFLSNTNVINSTMRFTLMRFLQIIMNNIYM